MREMKPIVRSIYDKRTEIHYDEWYIKNKEHKWVKLELQGKIKCPVLNESISSLCCAHIMENEGWPRALDPNICKKCNCYIYLSIAKFQKKSKQ